MTGFVPPKCAPSTSEKQRLLLVQSSGGRCEAEVLIPGSEVWARCFRLGVEVHHMLTRARGGDLLDMAGETYHLAALCPEHHNAAHAAGGRSAGLLIDGYVTFDSATGEIIYDGPDTYLLSTYGKRTA